MLGYAATIFLSALLMFIVQPVIARQILPWYGGSAAVWTTCMMFFQSVLLLGYLYAHSLQKWFTPRWAWRLHFIVLGLACLLLRTGPPAELRPSGGENLTWAIVALLTITVGLPFLALSATGPLVQAWHSTTHRTTTARRETYRLYALSNAGSMIALLGYPFLVEPLLPVSDQMQWWLVGFVLFAVVCCWSGSRTIASPNWHAGPTSGLGPELPDESSGERLTAPGLRMVAWALLAFTPTVLLMATTNLMCGEVAALPFLWILPLALYLLTLIVCFELPRFYRPLTAYLLTAVAVVAAMVLYHLGNRAGLALQVLGLSWALTAACFTCHGELERLKPPRRWLTLYYLLIAAGGAAGGAFVVIGAPHLFVDYYELHIGFLLTLILPIAIRLYRTRQGTGAATEVWFLTLVGLMAAGITLGSLLVLSAMGRQPGMLARCRNEYGRLSVWEDSEGYRMMVNGRTDHGGQFSSQDRAFRPSGYYRPGSGPWVAKEAIERSRQAEGTNRLRLHWGVIGLGTGSLIANGGDDDEFTFYEINPQVEQLARRHFGYLDRAADRAEVVLGDGRVQLQSDWNSSGSRQFDLLVLDAFHSDSIPAHLLTREAFDLYRRHLSENGIVLVHITNRFVDLRPVVRGLAEDAGWTSLLIEHPASSTRWVLLAESPELLLADRSSDPADSWPRDIRPLLWTDDFASVTHVVDWSFRIDWEGLVTGRSRTP